MQIKIKGQTLLLLPEKAIYWEEEQTLIISDLHLGKVSYFRKEGIPVPSGGIDKNFNRLNHLLSHYDVRRIIFTGDLFHGKENKEWELFKSWRKDFPDIRMDIVMGNHDLLSASHYSGASVAVSNCDLRISPFTFCH